MGARKVLGRFFSRGGVRPGWLGRAGAAFPWLVGRGSGASGLVADSSSCLICSRVGAYRSPSAAPAPLGPNLLPCPGAGGLVPFAPLSRRSPRPDQSQPARAKPLGSGVLKPAQRVARDPSKQGEHPQPRAPSSLRGRGWLCTGGLPASALDLGERRGEEKGPCHR